MYVVRLMLALSALGALGGCGHDRAQASDPVILSLGGQEVRRSAFQEYLRGLRRQESLDPAVERPLLTSFLEQQVLVLEARRRGWVADGASADDEQDAVRRLVS